MKIFVSAGETSGDVHAAHLVREIKKLEPSASFIGMGSENLLAAGADIRFDISKRGTVGLIETLPNLFHVYSAYLKMKSLLLKENPDLLLLVDSQGINLPLVEYAGKIGIKTVYYIAPQQWLWGTFEGAKKTARLINLIVSIFPQEYKIYKEAGANTVYFGHPLIDIVKPSLPEEERAAKFKAGGSPVVCLCPGSRTQEIKNVFPIILKSAKNLATVMPNAKFFVLSASSWAENYIKQSLEKFRFPAQIIKENKYDLLISSDLAIAASGTINLEASILGTPNIMVYKLNPLTYFIGKHFLKIGEKLNYFSMPNILLNKEFIPEFVQDNATPSSISKTAIKLLNQKKRLDNSALFELLGKGPVLPKIAQAILSFTRSL